MNWECLASEDPLDKSVVVRFMFTDTEISLKLPSFLIAHNLAQAIEREIAIAKRDGAMELAEAIRGTIYQITGDTR